MWFIDPGSFDLLEYTVDVGWFWNMMILNNRITRIHNAWKFWHLLHDFITVSSFSYMISFISWLLIHEWYCVDEDNPTDSTSRQKSPINSIPCTMIRASKITELHQKSWPFSETKKMWLSGFPHEWTPVMGLVKMARVARLGRNSRQPLDCRPCQRAQWKFEDQKTKIAIGYDPLLTDWWFGTWILFSISYMG